MRPNIVIVDARTTNPGDLSWAPVEALGNVTAYDFLPSDKVAECCMDADIIVSNKFMWTAEQIAKIPNCRLIQLLATGYNCIDFAAADAAGITVCNVPAYSTASVAQHAISLMLATTNHVAEYAQSVREGEWVRHEDFTYMLIPITELDGKVMGIIGMGAIGQRVALIAQALGMRVVFYNPHAKPQVEGPQCKQVSLDKLLAQSDVVSLHCPLTRDNGNMVDAAFLAKMKPGARLVNTARGGLVSSADVAAALESGHLGWYATDNVNPEPMNADDPLLTAPRAIITPHVAWASTEARARLIARVADGIEAFLAGNPINVVHD